MSRWRTLLLLGAALLASGCGPDSTAAPHTAQPSLTATSPAGEVAWPFVFKWEGAQPETVVRIRVMDEAERALYGIEARGTQIAAPSALKSLLAPGERYQWRVSRLDANGEEVGSSELTAFTLAD